MATPVDDDTTDASGRTAVEGPPVRLTIRARTVITVLAATTAALSALHIAGHGAALFGILNYEGRVVGAFDMDSETSIPTWFNMMLLLGISVTLGAIARATAMRRERRMWAILAVTFLFLSLDEGAALHESLMFATRNLLGITGGPLWYAWVIPVGIALLIAAPFVVGFVLRLPARTRGLMILAAALFLGGAIGIEVVSATAGAEVESFLRDEYDPVVWTLAAFEETLELAGLTVMAAAVILHLRDHALAGRALALDVR
ncbi:hypothetical protein NQ156_12390 [Microbacterium sp. zg.Y625]|uniref:hypothetical protein n=1 Tax=Microbacterium jiangjiandongii TaxID=3049071 RepID=UPI00214C3F8D|nr:MULTISPECIES: hypothetical protein [unclassified Microbacterium]MCR2793864.1 hypothetical protein [Microbacterium sp. zg.Y625]WIM26202.1 hypothetical protein QNO14_03870 [Microbacterium sp. zg-Y625]